MVLNLLVAIGVFLVSVLCYVMTTTLIVNMGLRYIRAGLGFWISVAIMMVVSLVAAAGHLVQIALWAIAFMICGEIASFNQAFYCSAQNYTAQGYGDVHLSQRWQLLAPRSREWPAPVRAIHGGHVRRVE